MQSRPAYIYAPPQGPVPVLHQEDAFLIVSKPDGLLSVPGRGAQHADCLESRLRENYPAARIVHRLDMSTSGVMVLAQTTEAHKNLSLQFEQRQTAKTYIARVYGHMTEEQGEITLPLIKDWPNRPKQMIDSVNGKASHTIWQVIAREAGNITRVRLTPLTGRTHQLRVHLQNLGFPILGDDLYATPTALAAASRLQLHAETLEFNHPLSGVRCKFTDPCPF
jgi:tRNA pseudouridine32 synthase/23S rRNA pseudouridine746 synthase